MFQRQTLQAFGSSRPICRIPARILNVRQMSDKLPGNRQRATEKGSNTTDTNPAPADSRNPPDYHKKDQNQTQFNRPNFSKTRHQQAARQSDETRGLTRDRPVAGDRGTPTGTQTFSQQTIDPEAIGRSPRDANVSLGGTMGENDSPGREGLLAPAYDRPNDSVNAQGENVSARRARAAEEEVVDEEGQEYVEEEGEEGMEEEDYDEDMEAGEDAGAITMSHELALLEQMDKEDVTAVPFNPEEVSKDALLKTGLGGSTLGNTAGMIEDHLRTIAAPTQDGVRVPRQIRQRMRQGHIVMIKDEAERKKVSKNCKGGKAFAPLPESVGKSIVDKLVRGTYEVSNTTTHKQEVLNMVSRNMQRNGTYLNADASRFLKKVQSLLPAATAARPAQRTAKK